MIDPKNIVNMTCGIVADPEMVHENILKLRVACDYSGDEKDSDNRSGYFDVTYFFNDGNFNADFVRKQVESGNFKKGSQIQLVGSLRQRRWKTEEGASRSMVDIRAESITYAGGARRDADDDATKTTAAPAPAAATIPDEF